MLIRDGEGATKFITVTVEVWWLLSCFNPPKMINKRADTQCRSDFVTYRTTQTHGPNTGGARL